MIYKTLSEARREHHPCSWKQVCIVTVRLQNGTTFYRTYTFDQTTDKCKRCRKAGNQASGWCGGRRRLHSTGHTCGQCGNVFAAFVRQGRISGTKDPNFGWWTESGRIH